MRKRKVKNNKEAVSRKWDAASSFSAQKNVGSYFLVSEQESNQRSRHRRGAESLAPASEATLPISSTPTLQAKSRNTFCLNRSYSKMLSSSPVRAGGFLRGRLCLREQATQRPLSRVLLVLFLARQEKYIPIDAFKIIH